MSINKNTIQMDSMHSSISGQSSLGILELDNMSGNYMSTIKLYILYIFIFLNV